MKMKSFNVRVKPRGRCRWSPCKSADWHFAHCGHCKVGFSKPTIMRWSWNPLDRHYECDHSKTEGLVEMNRYIIKRMKRQGL